MNLISKLLLTAILMTATFCLIYAQSNTKTMKIKPSQTAPAFTIKDVNEHLIKLEDLKGKKVMINFHRNVGCPICNLRFHELEQDSAMFRAKGLVILAVYESSSENMKTYLDSNSTYTVMIPNPDLSLYKLYGVEQSTGKLLKGMVNGAMGKIKKGNKLFTKKIKQDGSLNRINADFLIDENGKIIEAYYGKYVGDNISIETIKKFID
jgi:peroxiredoxin